MLTIFALFLFLGGSVTDSVLSQIVAQKKRNAGLFDAKALFPDASAPGCTLLPTVPDSTPPCIQNNTSLVANDLYYRLVHCLYMQLLYMQNEMKFTFIKEFEH